MIGFIESNASRLSKLDFDGEIQGELDGYPISISIDNRRVTVRSDAGLVARELGKASHVPFVVVRRLQRLVRMCQRADLAVDLLVGDRPVFQIGSDLPPKVWRLIGLPHFDLKLTRILSIVWRSVRRS